MIFFKTHDGYKKSYQSHNNLFVSALLTPKSKGISIQPNAMPLIFLQLYDMISWIMFACNETSVKCCHSLSQSDRKRMAWYAHVVSNIDRNGAAIHIADYDFMKEDFAKISDWKWLCAMWNPAWFLSHFRARDTHDSSWLTRHWYKHTLSGWL